LHRDQSSASEKKGNKNGNKTNKKKKKKKKKNLEGHEGVGVGIGPIISSACRVEEIVARVDAVVPQLPNGASTNPTETNKQIKQM